MTPARSPHLDGGPNGTSAPDHEAAIAGAPYLRHRRTHRSRGHDRPRIVQLLATGGSGGAQESYSGLLLRLDRSRYEVRAVSLSKGSAVQRLRRLGVEVEILDEADDQAAVRALADYLRRHEIDLVHSHMFRAELIGTRAALAAGTPVIVATVHSSRVRSAEDQAALAAITPALDRLIVPSTAIVAKIRAEGRHAPVSVIPNGVDLSRFESPAPPCTLRDEFAIPCDALLIGMVARLEREKGHRYLIEAMPQVVAAAPTAWLAIIGEGSSAAELQALARSLPAPVRERMVFTARRDDIGAVTGDLDVAVLPSLREAQGISILEAMARRKPIVASAVGGIPEVVTDGVDGLLVPPRDPAALAAALVRLASDATLRRRLGEAGAATVRRRFSIDAMVRSVEALYEAELVRSGVAARRRRGSVVRRQVTPAPGRAALEVPPL